MKSSALLLTLSLTLLFTLFCYYAVGYENEPTETSQTSEKVEVYTIQQGDTLEQIASEKYGDPKLWPKLARYNNITSPELIKVGQDILIPSKADLLLKTKEQESLDARLAELRYLISKIEGLSLDAIFEDNFEDDELDSKPKGWLFPSEGAWTPSGVWAISSFGSRMLEQRDIKAFNTEAMVGDKGWSNYTVQVELEIENSGDAGIFAYWNSRFENYRLRTLDRHTKLQIVKRASKGEKEYDTITLNELHFQLEDNTWYIFKLEVHTHESYIYLQGKVWKKGELEPGTWLIEASDHSAGKYVSGLAGIWTTNSGDSYRGAKFDNFKVLSNRN